MPKRTTNKKHVHMEDGKGWKIFQDKSNNKGVLKYRSLLRIQDSSSALIYCSKKKFKLHF